MHVYWVESFDHCEDWFIIAKTNRQAVKIFAEALGYEIVEDAVCASEVCPVPTDLVIEEFDFMDNQQILDCGGEFITFHDEDLLAHVDQELIDMVSGETRIVRFGKKVYMEGNVLRVALQAEGKFTNS